MNEQRQSDFYELYRSVNESFPRRLVFRAGIDAGFFAEFRYMVNAVIFCLQNRIQFCLYSRDANFAVERGWEDFFVPFCTEVTDGFHSRWNIHALPSLAELRQRNPRLSVSALLVWKLKTAFRGCMCRLISLFRYGRDTLSTYDIPQKPAERCIVPEMGMDCSYFEAFQKISAMIWQLNDTVLREAGPLLQSAGLPAHFAGMQIRGGDKITEVGLLSPDVFVSALKKTSSLRDILLLTDDYGVLESVRRKYPEYSWHSLCTAGECGYVNAAFARTAAADKREKMIRFLAQVDALLRSDVFVGSITVGPSLFVLQMLYPRAVAVDCEMSSLPAVAHLTIKVRGEIAVRYLENHANG